MYRVVLNSKISDLFELIQAVDYPFRHFTKSYGPGPELDFPTLSSVLYLASSLLQS